jgi:hypothetical protein
MEAPIPIQAPHSRSHLFRAHSSYSNDIYGMRSTSRDSRDMLSQPPRHYLGQNGSDNDSNAPASNRTHIDLTPQQAGFCRPMAMHPAHSVPQQLNPPAPRSYDPPRQESRVSVSNLLDTASPSLRSRQSITMRDSPSHPSSAPMSPRNTQPTPAEGRLPGVSQVSLAHLCDSRAC